MRLASVSPVLKKFRLSPCVVTPITCVTAIASPIARPSPSTDAASRPGPTYGITTLRIVSHRVAPRAIEPSWMSRRDAGEELARHAGDDGDDHDHEHDHGGQHARARVAERRLGEERRPAQHCGQCRRDVVPHDRPEDDDPPEPDQDARDTGQRLDHRTDRRPQRLRRQIGEEQADRDRDRSRDQEREQRT